MPATIEIQLKIDFSFEQTFQLVFILSELLFGLKASS